MHISIYYRLGPEPGGLIIHYGRSSDSSLLRRLLILRGQWHLPGIDGIYSCGHSSGLGPDSLFKDLRSSPQRLTTAKLQNSYLANKVVYMDYLIETLEQSIHEY